MTKIILFSQFQTRTQKKILQFTCIPTTPNDRHTKHLLAPLCAPHYKQYLIISALHLTQNTPIPTNH